MNRNKKHIPKKERAAHVAGPLRIFPDRTYFPLSCMTFISEDLPVL